MSYCRWSSDDFQCDVYVYADVHGGWQTWVAASRRVYKEPLPPPAPMSDLKAWMLREKVMRALLDITSLAPIGLPHDGEGFHDDTPGECADRLESLRALGYNVPQYAIDALREEQAALK